MTRFSILLILLLSGNYLIAQSPIFKNMGVNHGVPASETYNVMQDSKGFIWFSTEAGLCKFNGNTVKVYANQAGLPEKACYGIYEHPKGKIWIISAKNRVLYYNAQKDTFIEAGFCSELKKRLDTKPTSQLYLIKKYNDSTFWLCAQWTTFKVNIFTNKIEEFGKGTNDTYPFLVTQNDIYPIKFDNKKYWQNYLHGDIKLLYIKKDTSRLKINWKNKQPPSWRCLTATAKNGDHYIAWDNHLIKISNNLKIEQNYFEQPILSIYLDKDDHLWLGAYKGGLSFFKENDISKPIHTLDNLSVTGIVEDYEKGVWCSTLEKGIFYCKNKNIFNYSSTKGLDVKQDLLKSISPYLYCSSNDKTLFRLNTNSIEKIELKEEENYFVRDIIKVNQNYILTSYDGTSITDSTFKKKSFSSKTGGSKLIKTKNGNIYILQNATLYEFINRKEFKTIVHTLKSGATCIAEYGNSLLIGAKDGLYQLSFLDNSLTKFDLITGYVSAIAHTAKNGIWLTTKDNGLFVLKNGKIIDKTNELKLKGKRLFDIKEDNKEALWIASNQGLLKITENKTIVYNTNSGILSNEIFNIAVLKNEIYFSTNNGLYSFNNTEGLNNTSSPYVTIDSIFINGYPSQLSLSNYQLPYNQNSIKIILNALTFKNEGNTKLLTLLSGAPDSLKQFTGNKIEFSNLLPGNYSLKIWAVNNDGVPSEKPAILTFRINKPYWGTWWFILILILFFLSIILISIRIYTQNIKKKELQKTLINKQIAEYQLTALQAQMNPHFIFNAINSIQTYILENETQIAYDYLAKFAKLIRIVLNNAKENTINFEKEIELLKTYIELEQMRFENKFECTFLISPEIDTFNSLVPPMLIQPYVENAIWHGLMPLKNKRQGKLLLEIKKKNEHILIVIEDNGVGRSNSTKINKTPNHESVGMKLTENRIHIINELDKDQQTQVIVTDLFDNKNEAIGTRIELIISAVK